MSQGQTRMFHTLYKLILGVSLNNDLPQGTQVFFNIYITIVYFLPQ